MSKNEKPAPSKAKLRVIGIVAGAVLALVCHYVPEQYQTACHAVSQIASVTCGG